MSAAPPRPRPRAGAAARTLGAALVLALCALPVHGSESAPPEPVVHALTSIDALPTRSDLATVLGPANQIGQLRALALDSTLDFGVRLRAIRALPMFCSDTEPACRDALLALAQSVATAPEMPGEKVLRLRAVIDAFAAVRPRLSADRVLLESFLAHPSRDIRFAAVRALRLRCDTGAASILRDHAETVRQVQLEIDDALRTLAVCVQ